MKKLLYLVLFCALPFVFAHGQSLSSFETLNPDPNRRQYLSPSFGSMLRPRYKVHYLQSILGRDTTQTPYYFLNLEIYRDEPADCFFMYNDLYAGDYAIGSCVSCQGDTILVCMNKDLSVRFTFPDNTSRAFPFYNGIAKCLYSPWWAYHAAQCRFGAVTRNGTVLFQTNHKAVHIAKNKAIAVDKNYECNSKLWDEFYVVVKNAYGITEATFIYYYPKVLDCSFLNAGNDFWRDLESEDSSIFNDWPSLPPEQKLFYSAFVNMVQLDYLTSYNQLCQVARNSDPVVRKCAKKNIKQIRRLFGK